MSDKRIALATDATVKVTSRQRRASIISVAEIVTRLQEQSARSQDFLVPCGKLTAMRVAGELRVSLSGEKAMRMYDRVLPQLCGATATGGVSVPGAYTRQLLTTGETEAERDTFIDLAANNINTLLQVKANRGKQHFVRTLLDDDNQPVIRAVLSDRYLPINSLDMITNALGVVTGKIKAGEGAVGAQAFDWHLDPFRLSVGFVNPTIAFDIKNPQRGLIRAEAKQDGHGWVYPGGGTFEMSRKSSDPAHHLVFPACFISNSDTGGGSANVEVAMLEAACINTSRLGTTFVQRHLGAQQTDLYDSQATQQNVRRLWLSRIVDGLTQVFDPANFEANCRKFLALAETEVRDVVKLGRQLFESGLPGGESMLEEFLKSYQQMTPGEDTLLDVNRALTSIAQHQNPMVQDALETFAGQMIIEGPDAISGLKKAAALA